MSFSYHFEHDYSPVAEPAWKERVGRWYQLDAPSLALCESYWQNQSKLQEHPDAILLNSPHTSFRTDKAFCKTLSPSKFVHTLPSVRTSALFQLMHWRGPAFSFVDDREKIESYARELVEKSLYNHVWVLHVDEQPTLKVRWSIIRTSGDPHE